jgi:hypothetical protein
MKSVLQVLLFLSLVLAGCISTPVEEEAHSPSLMVSQNSDGVTTAIWESEPGYVYTIYYQDRPGGEWLPLRTASRVRGTGETLSASDRVNPNKSIRRYRLGFEPVN